MTSPVPPPAEDADRILLVDDDATNLDVLRQALDGRGYRLFVAKSGETALEVARKARPALVLLDVVMPGIDGYETCRRLKDDPETREAAVVFISSLDETKDKVRGLEVGAVDFISKPFQRDEVIARVNTHLTLHRLRRQLEARNAELARELEVAQELLADARRRVEGALLGSSPAVRALRETIAQRAASAGPLLLTGPMGAGGRRRSRGRSTTSRRGAARRSSTSTARCSRRARSRGCWPGRARRTWPPERPGPSARWSWPSAGRSTSRRSTSCRRSCRSG